LKGDYYKICRYLVHLVKTKNENCIYRNRPRRIRGDGNCTEVDVQDLPVTEDTFLKNQSKSLDIIAFTEMIEKALNCPIGCSRYSLCALNYVVLATEQMQSMGWKTPPKTLTMLAEMSGHIEAVVRLTCRTRNIPLFMRKYQPKTWTHWLFPDSEDRNTQKAAAKNESLEKARELFPTLQEELKLKKYHDRAEALLIAFTALAEMSGCIVDPKLAAFNKLVNVYLNHNQSTKNRQAKLTDVYKAVQLPKTPVLTEINKRLNQ